MSVGQTGRVAVPGACTFALPAEDLIYKSSVAQLFLRCSVLSVDSISGCYFDTRWNAFAFSGEVSSDNVNVQMCKVRFLFSLINFIPTD